MFIIIIKNVYENFIVSKLKNGSSFTVLIYFNTYVKSYVLPYYIMNVLPHCMYLILRFVKMAW